MTTILGFTSDTNVSPRDIFAELEQDDLTLGFETVEAARRAYNKLRLHRWRHGPKSIVIRWPKYGLALRVTTQEREAARRAEVAKVVELERFDRTWPATLRHLGKELQVGLPGVGEKGDVQDFLMFVGSSYYPTVKDFVGEAALLGVSKRIGLIPSDMQVGRSRVFLAHEGPGGLITCPVCKGGEDRFDCKRCRGMGAAREHIIFGFFSVSGIDLIVRDEDIDALADKIARTDVRQVTVSEAVLEPARGCGHRKVGGMYLVSSPADGITVFREPIAYLGRHFLGIKRYDLVHTDQTTRRRSGGSSPPLPIAPALSQRREG